MFVVAVSEMSATSFDWPDRGVPERSTACFWLVGSRCCREIDAARVLIDWSDRVVAEMSATGFDRSGRGVAERYAACCVIGRVLMMRRYNYCYACHPTVCSAVLEKDLTGSK